MCDQCGCGETDTDQTFEEKVKEIIESTIRPALQAHGGDIELVETDADNNIKLRLQGACQGCPGAKMTMTAGVERILRQQIPETKEVTAVD